jgi:hypothetical protein
MSTVATAHEETIDSAKGTKIFVRSWAPEYPPRASRLPPSKASAISLRGCQS